MLSAAMQFYRKIMSLVSMKIISSYIYCHCFFLKYKMQLIACPHQHISDCKLFCYSYLSNLHLTMVKYILLKLPTFLYFLFVRNLQDK